MKQLVIRLLGKRLQPVLIACFALVAALTVGLSAVITLRVITDYLDGAMDRRVARDMDLATAFYQLKLDEVAAVSQRIGSDPPVIDNLTAASAGSAEAATIIDQALTRKITVPTLGGTHLLLVLDAGGDVVAGRVLASEGRLSQPITGGNWRSLPVVAAVLASGRQRSATEVLPAELLDQVGLADQARLVLVDTPLAAPEPFDPREGTAGLALTGVYPVYDASAKVLGVVVAAHLFNNDFSLVDRIKEVAGIDTATIFFGDLRVSTNVMTEEGQRAVGTRISQDVYDVVLEQGRDYVGRAFVVNDWFITRYEPLRDYLGRIVGSLYVGARESTFQALVHSFNNQVALIALISMALAAVVAIPIATLLTNPITELVEANRQLAKGNMMARVKPYGTGELAELGRAFNRLAETLENTQQNLLHKERLAAMGQLAAGVAHEINNPLGTILLFSDTLYQEADADDPRRDDLKMIVDETLRCKNIVAHLLNFARQQEVLAQDTDINALLDRSIELMEHQPQFADIEIRRQYSPELPVVQADPNQLLQVFANLLRNAAESMEDGGTITLSTRLIAGPLVEIKVSDTGIGITRENMGKMFTPFFTTKALGKGMGLGLSIVYGIIKMHKGQIMVQSQAGQGTTFTITLPVQSARDTVFAISSSIEVVP
jgi:two-component system, NtrC family, sensor kinase